MLFWWLANLDKMNPSQLQLDCDSVKKKTLILKRGVHEMQECEVEVQSITSPFPSFVISHLARPVTLVSSSMNKRVAEQVQLNSL
jgi:hypothetical protein